MIITVNVIYYAPTVGTPNAYVSFSIYEYDKNAWGTAEQLGVAPLASEGGPICPGLNTLVIHVSSINFSKLYLTGHGSIRNDHPPESIFVAEPPSGHVSDAEAFGVWGPPWISLEKLNEETGISADLFIINGIDNQIGSAHPWVVGAWAVNREVNLTGNQGSLPKINSIKASD